MSCSDFSRFVANTAAEFVKVLLTANCLSLAGSSVTIQCVTGCVCYSVNARKAQFPGKYLQSWTETQPAGGDSHCSVFSRYSVVSVLKLACQCLFKHLDGWNNWRVFKINFVYIHTVVPFFLCLLLSLCKLQEVVYASTIEFGFCVTWDGIWEITYFSHFPYICVA